MSNNGESTYDPKAVRDWLRTLHLRSAGYVWVGGQSDGWKGRCFSTEQSGWIELAGQRVDQANAANPIGVYFRCTTLAKPPPEGRGLKRDSLTLSCLWADLDVAGPGHADISLPPDEATARSVVTSSGLPEPSIWVHTGGGLSAWWLLNQPHQITDYEAIRDLNHQWHDALKESAGRLGFSHDGAVRDLSRIMRIPGTINRKEGLARPCYVLSQNGPRYDLGDFVAALAEVERNAPPKLVAPGRITRKAPAPGSGVKPGDDFNDRADMFDDILGPAGWTRDHEDASKVYIVRPGKRRSEGHSATISKDTGNLWVFTSSVPELPPCDDRAGAYSKFHVYAALHHGGDYSGAAKELRRKGYGSAPAARPIPVSEAAPDHYSPAVTTPLVAVPENARGLGATPLVAGVGFARRFPTEHLPTAMQAYAIDLATRKQVPVDLPVLTMLGMVGAMAGPRITIRRDLDWRQPTNIYTCCALSSGAGKSPTVEELRKGLHGAIEVIERKHGIDLAQLLVAKNGEIEALRTAANDITTPIPEREAMRAKAKRIEEQIADAEKTPPPAPKILIDGDMTVEALCGELGANNGAGAIVDDEGTFLRILGGMYGGGATGNLGLVLKGYDCHSYNPKRVSREIGTIARAALSLVMAPQPRIVADMLSNQQMDDLGFINRFIISIPGELNGQRKDRPSTYYLDAPPGGVDRSGRTWWADVLRGLAAYDVIGAKSEEDSATIDLTRGAWKLHYDYERHFEPRVHPTRGDLRTIGPWANKHVGRVLRVAALLHLATGYPVEQELNESVMEAAISIGEWTIEHYLSVIDNIGLSTDAGRIAEFVDSSETGFKSRSEISAQVFKRNVTAARLSKLFDELVTTKRYKIGVLPAERGRAAEVLMRIGHAAPEQVAA